MIAWASNKAVTAEDAEETCPLRNSARASVTLAVQFPYCNDSERS